eukprot:5751705-Ditylum_brightwellii.AAC.1
MAKPEKKNITASLSCIKKDVMARENVTLGSARKNIVITMGFATMTQRNETIIKLAGSMFSPLTISKKSRGSGRSSLLRRLR